MFALMHEAKSYDVMLAAFTQFAACRLTHERAFIGTSWGGQIFLIDAGSDCLY